MKQAFRFLVNPGSFFNQLQWSRHHWFIVTAFLAIASVETHLSRHNMLYAGFADLLQAKWGISHPLALWTMMAAKLFATLIGAYLMLNLIYFAGTLFGSRAGSRRVFMRRLAVVFTVMLFGYTLHSLQNYFAGAAMFSIALYAWGAFLGFHAIREQFSLSVAEAVLMSAFAFFLVGTSWQLSQTTFESFVADHTKNLTHRTDVAPKAGAYRKGTTF